MLNFNMQKLLLVLLLVLIQGLLGTSSFAEDKDRIIVLGVTKSVLESSRGQFSKRLYETIFGRLNYTLKIEVFPPIRLVERTKSAKIDGELIRMSGYGIKHAYLTKVEEAHFNFSIVVYSAKKMKIHGWKDLQNLNSGHRRGVKVVENELHKNLDKKLYNSYDDLNQVVKLLNSKRLDTYIGVEFLTDEFLKKNNIEGILKVGRLKSDSAHVFLGAKYSFLATTLSKELKKMKLSGEYQKMQN